MSASGQEDRRGLLDYKVGIGMQRTVIDERHTSSRRYPQSLVPLRWIDVDGFTVSLAYKRSREPEASSVGRRLFEEVLDAVEDVIRNFDTSVIVDEQQGHGSPSIDAHGPESRGASESIVGAASGVAPSTTPDASSEEMGS